MASPIQIFLPTLHPDQVRAYLLRRADGTRPRFKAIRCGRRWGKTDLGKTIAADGAAKGQRIGWFAPDYKVSAEAFNEVAEILQPVRRQSSKIEGVFRTKTNGRIDFWTLENERAGRSRKYHKVIIDEGAFTKSNMMDIWNKSIKPTLLDYGGECWVLSNTNGVDRENFFWRICNEPEWGFTEYHAPTHKNPYLPQDELDKLIHDNAPLVYQQEYLAEFVDWSGVAFFELQKMLLNGNAVPYPTICDGVFATIDTATKTGQTNDGTAVTYWATSQHGPIPLIVLDYDYAQIEGSLLEAWLPTVFQRGEELAKQCRARMGFVGAWIEDKASGMVLLQQAARRNWPAAAIDSKLTSVGKSERAISVSGYVYRGIVKFSQVAYDKIVVYKGASRNHLVSQVLGFRIGIKPKDMTDDDLLDSFCYGIAIALGNQEGF